MALSFQHMLERRWRENGARICVGLDTHPSRLPPKLVEKGLVVSTFNKKIVAATADTALAYKPNIAFYSGEEYLRNHLLETIKFIRFRAPDVPIILDAKRGDIDSTNVGYVEEVFGLYGVDAVTVSHYLGRQAMKPFLNQQDKGIIVLCRTSNPGAEWMQEVLVEQHGILIPYYQYVARQIATYWNEHGNCSLVVGATRPEQLQVVRKEIGDEMWLLNPGVGAQGADVAAAVQNGKNRFGSGLIINASRSIIYSSDGEDFAEAAQAELLRLTEQVRSVFMESN